MNRRDLLRNTLITSIAASTAVEPHIALALEFPANFDASKDLERSDWKPIFLDAHQNETLIVLSEAIIPQTDTPGAKAAYVNRFLDLLMASETPDTQRAFVEALAYIDGASQQRFKQAFVYLTPDQQNNLLELWAYPHDLEQWGETDAVFIGNRHFNKLKVWIASAFYSSPIGLKIMGWDGTFPHGSFSGCDHAAGQHSNS